MCVFLQLYPLSLVLEDLSVNRLGEAPVFPRKFGLIGAIYDQFTQMVYVGIHGLFTMYITYDIFTDITKIEQKQDAAAKKLHQLWKTNARNAVSWYLRLWCGKKQKKQRFCSR